MPRRAAAVTVAASAAENNSEDASPNDTQVPDLPRFEKPALFALHSCGRSTRKLRNAIANVKNATVNRAADMWTPNTTHLVLPSLSRNVKIVCVLAGGGQLARPNFVDLVRNLQYVPLDVPPEYGWDLSKQDTPRYHHDAANVWRRRRKAGRGGVLRGMRVFIVGELVPKRARGADGLISTTMAEAILEAADAVVLSTPEGADFALLTDVEIEKKHPAIPRLRDANVPCFGPAILTDLIRRVSIKPTEFLAFKDQANLCQKSVSVHDAEHSDIIPILVHRSGHAVAVNEGLTAQKTNSPRRKPKPSISPKKSSVVPARNQAAKPRSKVSPKGKISKRRSRANSKARNQERSIAKEDVPSVLIISKGSEVKGDIPVSPDGKRVTPTPQSVNLKLRIKRPRFAVSKEPDPVPDCSITFRPSPGSQPILLSKPRVSISPEPPTSSPVQRHLEASVIVNDANQTDHSAKTPKNSSQGADAGIRLGSPRDTNPRTSVEDGSNPTEPQSSQADPVSLLLSLAKSPASGPIPPPVSHPGNSNPIPFPDSIARPIFSHEPSPQLPVRSQLTPKIPSIPVLPQAGLSHFVLPPPSPTIQHAPAVPRIGLSPIGSISLPPISSHPVTGNGSLPARVPQFGSHPSENILNNRTPSSLFSPVPDPQRPGASDFTTLLAPLAVSQPPLIGAPHTPKASCLSMSPGKRKTMFEGNTTNASPATPENIDESPRKRRRSNGNGAMKIRPSLDFRLAHGAQKALSQTQNEPTTPGSASTVRLSLTVAHEEDVSGACASVVRDVRTNPSDPGHESRTHVHERRASVDQRNTNEVLVRSLVESICDIAFSASEKPKAKVDVIVLDSDRDEELFAKKRKEVHTNRNNDASSDESHFTKVQLSQVRKRPRRIIQESPPSDDDDDNEGEESSAIEIRRVNESQLSIPSKSSAESNEVEVVSIGSSRHRYRGHVRSAGIDAHPNRRRVQLRTPGNNGTKNRFQAVGTGVDAKLMNELTAIVVDRFGSVPSVEDGYKKIVDWIGGEVSEGQLEQFKDTDEHQLQRMNQTKNQATNTKKRPRGRGTTVVIHDDSPPENDVKSDATIDLMSNESEIVELREVDRPTRIRGHSNPHNVASMQTDVLFDAFEPPPRVLVPAPCIPRHLSCLTRCPANLDMARGVEEDDKRLAVEIIQFKDWLFCAEHLDLGDEAREYLHNHDAPNVVDVVDGCVRSLEDASVLSHIAVLSDVSTPRLRAIVGICMRFLASVQSKRLLGSFLELLLKARELQQAKGRDSLTYLFSKSSGSSKAKHELLQFIWIGFTDACRRYSSPNTISLLWTLFNEKWLGNSNRMPVQLQNSSSYKIIDLATHKLLDSLRTIACLFAFSLDLNELSVDAPVILYPNWTALGVIVQKIVSRSYDSIDVHRKVLTSFLWNVCGQFVDKLWKVDEDFVVQVLDAIKLLCAKYDRPCSCIEVHSFLTQFNSISDLRARRRSLQDYLRTDCECASFLAWVSVAQENEMSSKLSAKILRHNSQFIRANGVVKDPARALTHHLGLTLAISDSIVEGRADKENLLRSMLFSKAPRVAQAVQNLLDFDTRIVESWSGVLETINLRCRHLLASGHSIYVYSDYIFENMFATLKCIEKPESAKPISIEERESRRVQQAVLVKLMVRMLTGFADVVKLVVHHVDQGQYSNFSAVDSLLISLSKFVKRLGKFSVGLISQIRSNSVGGSAASRQEVLLAILTFVEQGLALCTVRTRQDKRVSAQGLQPIHHNSTLNVSGCFAFSKQVQCEMLESFVNMVQYPVFQSAPKLDADVRISASRALARTVALSCVGPHAAYSMHNSSELVGILMRAKMTLLGNADHYTPTSGTSTNSNSEQAQTKLGLRMQIEFWSIVLNDTWSPAILVLSESFPEIIFGLWIILLVISYAENEESELAKTVPKLSYGIQKAVRTNKFLAKWFKETLSFSEYSDIVVMNSPETELNKLDPKSRLEALTASFSVLLDSWASTKVHNLVAFIRKYIRLSWKNRNGKYEAFNASQNHWRTTRDLQDGEIALLHTQVLAVLFVVDASLNMSAPPSHYRGGGRVGKEKSSSSLYLTEISDSLMKAMNKLRKDKDDKAQSVIQILVVTALATDGNGLNDVQTSVNFLRFLRICGDGNSLSNLVSWNDESKVPIFMRRTPFTSYLAKARDEKEKQRYLGIQKRSRKVREVVLSTLVEEPIQRKASDTLEFRTALERFCLLLRQKETVANLRETGLWPNICQVVATIGKRGNVAQREKVWMALRSEMLESEAMYFRTSLRR